MWIILNTHCLLHGPAPEKLLVTRLAKKFWTFCGTQRFLTVFTQVFNWSLSWARFIQSISSYPISLRSFLMLSSHLCLGLPTCLFPSGFPTKILCTSHLSHMCYMPPSHPPWLDPPSNIWWTMQVMTLLIIQSSPASCHFLQLRFKYSPQHPALKHSQSMFFL